jgi:hypothetical protein
LIKPIAAVAIALAAVFGQILPSCDDQSRVVRGFVDDKYIEGPQHIIVVDRRPFDVPSTFWHEVQVGDTVRFDGRNWEIVRRRGEPSRLVPITIVSPAPTPTPTPTPAP